MTQPNVPDRKTKRADELVAGDIIADDLYDEPTPILGVHPFVDCGAPAILAVVRDADGVVFAREFDTAADVPVEAVTDERAARIAEIRKLADWLERNPDVPMPIEFYGQQQMASPGFRDGISAAEGLARVRSFAEQFDVKVNESNYDRTSAEVKFGIARYSLLTWHADGRPGQPDDRDAELERLRAEVAELRAGNGLDYSRTDSEPDDPTPVSPARAPLHVGVVDDGGPVEEVVTRHLSSDITRRYIGEVADLRNGEQGRVTDLNLAHLLAVKEERKRIARNFLGLEESAKHYPPAGAALHGGPCWPGCKHEPR